MVRSEYFFPSSDGKTLIHVSQWTPLNREIRGVVQIAHGVGEHGGRYAPFARFLCKNGFVAVADDHLGHGLSRIPDRPMVYLGDENGWRNAVDDLEALRRRTAQEFAGKPYFLLGHSMGSFLTRTLLIRYPGTLTGCVISGTGHQSPLAVAGGLAVVRREIRRLGRTAFSARADRLAFGLYNRPFAPNRTAFDWMSRNEENVDAFMADPLCSGNTTLGLFQDMLGGVRFLTRQSSINQMDKNLPVLFISGDQDPVGEMGRGVRRARSCFVRAGLRDVSCKLYHGLRHEILNETTRQYVYQDVLDWLEAHM